MKQFYLYIVSVTLLLLSACSSDNDELPGGGDNTPPDALHIEVSASDFANANGISTRATDSGNATTFENGDCIGITVLDASNNVLYNNIPYKYNGSTWSFDSGNSESKTAIYYDNKAGNQTYLAYFPYSAEANDVKSKDELKAKFQPQYDQRSKDAYRTSDLLVWSKAATAGASPKKLEIEFKHAYSSLAFSSSIEIKCNLTGESSETTYSSSLISDVGFTLNGEPYSAYKAEDGSYRIITVPQSSGVSARWFCTYSAETYNGSVSVNALAEEHRYTLAPSLNLGNYSLDKAKMGDFYCKSSDGSTGYLIPGDIATLTEAQKSACLGIVLKAGKDASGNWKDEGSYTLKGTTTEMSTIHGYVLALKDGNGGSTCAWGSSSTIGTDQSQYTLFCGYSNMQTIKAYLNTHSDKSLQTDFPAAYHASEGYETIESGKYSSPGNSSGWFLPSAGQCWYWYQYRVLLKESMDKVGGDGWYNYYWSSSESNYSPTDVACYVDFSNGNVDNYGNKRNTRRVRSCLAF